MRIAFTSLRRVTRNLPVVLERLEVSIAGYTANSSHSSKADCLHFVAHDALSSPLRFLQSITGECLLLQVIEWQWK